MADKSGRLSCEDKETATEGNEKDHSTRRVNTGITAESLYLTLAMWMEMFPEQCTSLGDSLSSDLTKEADKSTDFYRKIGCVLVQQNASFVAVDWSRDGVHGLARMLVKHHGKTTGCSVFVSRKPCTYCAKLLVKAGVIAVSYPPVEPEFLNSKEEKRVGILFDAGGITQNIFVPQIRTDLVTMAEEELVAQGISLNDIREYTEKVLRRFWSEDYVKRMSGDITKQTYSEFENFVKWLVRIYIPLERSKFRCFSSTGEPATEEKIIRNFDPENNKYQEQIAKHLLGLAAMTIQRTVEPKTGVGCVILKDHDIVAVGWNDFPSNIIEEDFHNASDQERDKRYPFFVHAEQNALLMRNTTDVTGGIIFVTKTPCHECTPLVKLSGIGTVVLANKLEPIKERYRLNYEVFREEVEKRSFLCFEMIKIQDWKCIHVN